jgi:PAS domain S-box-containing protein
MKTSAPSSTIQTRLEKLRKRLRTAEDTLRAIQAGEVDAVVTGSHSKRVVTLAGAELPYSIMFDQMNEGAVTLTRDGTVAHCNRRFAEMVRTTPERIVGTSLQRFVAPGDHTALSVLQKAAGKGSTRGELNLVCPEGGPIPVSVSFAPLQLEHSALPIGLIAVVADISERRRAEALQVRLTAQVMTAQDEERRRIARELHDDTGQTLTGLLVGLRSIEASGTVTETREMAEQLRGIAAEGLSNLQRMVSGLHPTALDELGLSAAVTRHVHQFSELHGLPVTLQVVGVKPDGLPSLVQNTIYRVLQEALTNIAKHSRARAARVRLSWRKAMVELQVKDNGVGIRQQSGGAPGPGLGLKGMRERAALLGGVIDIDSTPSEGTTINCRIPLDSAMLSASPRKPVRTRSR